jgi:1A family penicillin-binding protein
MTSPTPQTSSSPRSETVAAIRGLSDALRRDASALWTGWIRARNQKTSVRPLVAWKLAKGLALFFILAALTFCGSMLWVLRDLSLDGVSTARERAILLESADGKPLGRVGPLKVSNAPRKDFPKHLVDAVLSIEDRRFYGHWGVDLFGIARALRRNYASGATLQGGSTITQQLVKLRIVGSERSLTRKIREAFAAMWLEMRLDKNQILTRYLNSVYMGAGAQGIPAAAELYFNKRPRDLTIPEAAMLAGMIKAPSRFNPLQNLAGAHKRAAVVVQAMVENGKLTEEAARSARAHPAALNTPAIASESGTWFSDWVAGEAQDVTGGHVGTMRVRTTLDPNLQNAAEQTVADGLRVGADQEVSEAALVAMRPDGAVLAMVGGRNYKQSQFNRAVQARRQPGSAFKLFVYLAALRSGLDLNNTIDASPIKIGPWNPQNYDGRSYGRVTLADAFAHSLNTAAVRLATDVGLEKVIAAARELGIEGSLPDVPSLALGVADVSLLNITSAYAAVRAGHAPIRPWGVASFASEEKPRLVSIGAPSSNQKSLGKANDKLIELLRLPIERGTATAAAIDGFAAGKTGTTEDHRDAWFIGFTDKLVVGVWVGNDDRSPMKGVTGGSLPAHIWKSFIERASHPPTAQETASVSDVEAVATGANDSACDYRACAAKYQSFNGADCTYQPYGGGPRSLCEEGSSGTARSASLRLVESQKQCDVEACAAAYSSFNSTDCTYQPLDGGDRRLCQKSIRSGSAREPTTQRARREEESEPSSQAGYRGLLNEFLRP